MDSSTALSVPALAVGIRRRLLAVTELLWVKWMHSYKGTRVRSWYQKDSVYVLCWSLLSPYDKINYQNQHSGVRVYFTTSGRAGNFRGQSWRGGCAERSIRIVRKQRDILCISSLFFPPLLHPDPQLRDGAIRIQGKSSLLINPLWKYLIATSHPSQLSGQDKQSHSHYVTWLEAVGDCGFGWLGYYVRAFI